MKSPFSAVSSPRVPSGVGWIGVGFAVGMIVFSAAKKLARGDFKRKRGTRTPEPQPKAQMKHEPAKTAATPKRPAATPKSTPKPAASKAVPATKTASPAGREEVTAQKAAKSSATQSPPKKKPTKVSTARKKTTPGVNTNPKNSKPQPS